MEGKGLSVALRDLIRFSYVPFQVFFARLDEDSLDVVEVDFATCAVLLFAERTNNKRTLHVHRFD
jgi:hypothetical protein